MLRGLVGSTVHGLNANDVQFTPPGSGCTVQFGTHITSARPGSAQGLYLVVSNIEAARDGLVARGVAVRDLFHAGTPGAQFQPDGTRGRVTGPAPDHATYSSYATFSDPDGNGWLLQEVTTRLPGRVGERRLRDEAHRNEQAHRRSRH